MLLDRLSDFGYGRWIDEINIKYYILRLSIYNISLIPTIGITTHFLLYLLILVTLFILLYNEL